jgi:hypothetical protein
VVAVNPETTRSFAPLQLPPVRLEECDDDDELLGVDVAALKSLIEQRDVQAAVFQRLKDRLLGRD